MYYRRTLQQVCSNEAALLVRGRGEDKMLRLEGTGYRIWELLEYPLSIEQLVHTLACEFTADPAEIEKDVSRFVDALLERRLVEMCGPQTPEEKQRSRYLSLLKRALVNLIYLEHEMRIHFLKQPSGTADRLERLRYLRDMRYREAELYRKLTAAKQAIGFSGLISYGFPHTMVGLSGLNNLERCAEQVFGEDIPGDFAEAGVCQGGAAIFLRALQVAFGQAGRCTWVADSFQGLPKSRTEPDVAAGMDWSEPSQPRFAFHIEGVRDNFVRYGLLDDRVFFLPGWFSESLPGAPIEQLAILRVDADLYESTRDVLQSLYDKITPGGFAIVDDYGGLATCRQAVDEFRKHRAITAPLHFVNFSCVYWRKE